MKLPIHTLLPAAVLCFLYSPLPAQASKVLPKSGTREGSSATIAVAGLGKGRIQQVIDAAAICKTSATLTAIALRPDGGHRTALSAKKIQSFKLSIGHTKASSSTMNTAFALNRTSTMSVVWSSALNLPAQAMTVRVFNIILKFSKPFAFKSASGNLLLEFEANDANNTSPYSFDAHMQSKLTGASSTYGNAGTINARIQPRIACEADYFLKPGRQAIVNLSAITKNYPTILVWGFSADRWGPLPLPFHLIPFGAPGNYLNLSMDFLQPISLVKSGNTYVGRSVYPLPNSNIVLDKTIYAQAMFLDSSSNKLGLVFTAGLLMQMQATSNAPVQWVQNNDPTKLSGYKGNGGEGLVLRLDGSFQ